MDARFWDPPTCCLDLTQDGVPDLAFTTFEWDSLPNGNLLGPHRATSRVVVFDGATGERVWERDVRSDFVVANSGPREGRYTLMEYGLRGWSYGLELHAVGDADGDGFGDILLEEWRFDEASAPGAFRRELRMLRGQDGSESWHWETQRDVRIQVLGDADGDGGNDLLMVTWFGVEGGVRVPEDAVTPQPLDLWVLRGLDGGLVQRFRTFAAPIDVEHSLRLAQVNGVPDLDGDGVGEVFTDDPVLFGEQVQVHRITARSGTSGAPILRFEVVGGFAIPTRAPDRTGDGRDDLLVLSGDVNDLWVTFVDGASGQAQWSRRWLALPTAGPSEMLPLLRVHDLGMPTSGPDLLIHGHVRLRMYDDYAGIFGPRTTIEEVTVPRLLAVRHDSDAGSWSRSSHPMSLADGKRGATPASERYRALMDEAEPSLSSMASETLSAEWPALATFALAVVLTAGVATKLARARSGDDREVPDLD